LTFLRFHEQVEGLAMKTVNYIRAGAGLILAALAWQIPIAAAKPSSYRELLVALDHETFSVVQQTVRPGIMPEPSVPQFPEGYWVVRAEDARGRARYLSSISEPRAWNDRATFVIRLPDDRRIVRVQLFRLTRSVRIPHVVAAPIRLPADALERIGTLAITKHRQ
jgi:hypothetical protein